MQPDNKLYQPLNLSKPELPLSSRLYSLKPNGIGTSLVESLTGYISRLAEAHCVFPGILMERVIAPIIEKKYSSANLHKIYGFTGALNGTGVMAMDMIQALETLTCYNNLHGLTLINLSELLPNRNLLRLTRAWCPKCYELWRSSGTVVYDSLLWVLKVVRVCPNHSLALLEQCPHCHQKNLPLAWSTRPGYCSKCKSWLGDISHNKLDNVSSNDELQWHLWIAKNLGDLIAASSALKLSFDKEKLAQSLKTYAEVMTQGNLAALARYLKIPKNTFWLWCQGKNQPTLEALVRICYCLRVSLLDFLTQEPSEISCSELFPRHLPSQSKSRIAGKPFDTTRVRQYLEAALLSDETPPPSMKEIARRLDCDKRMIYQYFRDLCRQISARYTNYRRASYLQAVKECCQEVQKAVRELYNQGKYPTEALVCEIIPQPGYLRYKQVRQALKEAQQELGLKG